MTPEEDSICLSEEELLACLAGECAGDAGERHSRHIESCDTCKARRRQLEFRHESWVKQLRDAGAPRDWGELIDTAAPDQSRGDWLAGYRIVAEIGRGGQSIVYRAVQVSTRRVVAVKVLRGGPYATPVARRRFEREVEIIARLRHPGIVAVFDSGVTADGHPFCALELVAGSRVDEYVRGHRLNAEAVVRLICDVCDAVNHAHQHGVIHRDLKPSNIIVDAEARPRVLDFGLARMQERGDATCITADGFVAGTLPYLSPEQAAGLHDEIDLRSDVYSLGVVLYYLLTGRHPYPVDGPPSDALRNIVERQAAPLFDIKPRRSMSVPAESLDRNRRDLQIVVQTALAKDRERRYQSAGELARDLGRWLSGEAIEARRDSSLYILRKTLRRHRGSVAIATAFLLLVSCSAITLGVLYRRQGHLLKQVELERGAARTAQASAERRFAELRSLARTFIFELDPKVADLPGAEPLRRFIIESGLKYLDSLAEELPADELTLQAELGAAYCQLASVLGDPQESNLGDLNAALDCYQRGIPFVERVVARQPDGIVPRLGLHAACLRVAGVLKSLGRELEAAAYERRAKTELRELNARAPNHPGVRLATILDQQSEAERAERAGDADTVIGRYETLIDELHELDVQTPGDERVLHALGMLESRLGGLHEARGRTAQAMECYARGIDSMAALARAQPNRARFRLDLSTLYDKAGVALQQLQRNSEAAKHFRSALELARSVCAASPDSIPAKVYLQRSLCRTGEIQLAASEWDAASRTFDEHLRLALDISKARPDSAAAEREVAVACYKHMELQKSRSQSEALGANERLSACREARRWLADCIARFEAMRSGGRLAAADSSVPQELASELAALDEQIRSLESIASPPASSLSP